MDAKQVWRAALGELQVTLSPANFETWLRDTALVEVDDTRFRTTFGPSEGTRAAATPIGRAVEDTLAAHIPANAQGHR